MPKSDGVNAFDEDSSENDSSFDSDEESLSDEDDSFESSNHDSGNAESQHNAEANEMFDIAQEDARKLRTWRVIILIVVLISFLGTITGVVLFLQNEAIKNEDFVYKLMIKSARDIVNQKSEAYRKAMANLAETISASAKDQEFPFVSVPMFETLASHTRSVLGNGVAIWAPFVTESQREQWATFSLLGLFWYNESKTALQDDPNNSMDQYIDGGEFRDTIWEGPNLNDSSYIAAAAPGPFAPLWQSSPLPLSVTSINYNLLYEENIREVIPAFIQSNDCVMSSAALDAGGLSTEIDEDQRVDHPRSIHLTPVFGRPHSNSTIVGFILSTLYWEEFLSGIFTSDVDGLVMLLKNNCGQVITFEVKKGEVQFVAMGDFYDIASDKSEVSMLINSNEYNATANIPGHCLYTLSMYRTKSFTAQADQNGNVKNVPVLCALFVLFSFFLMALTFALYDRFVNNRNDKIVQAAARSNAIISSLFPTQVRDRLFAAKDDKYAQDYVTPKKKLKNMMTNGEFQADVNDDGDDADFMYKTKPIADLFPETTIIFADIAGFTAWSSVREPTQVFILLETLYRAFDEIAKRRRVFKVETVGDCYVAVTGLPDPRKDHAIAMCRFARECMLRMQVLVRKLEVTLGPDTGDLSMRMGIHSGPVTAGVLRGERSRFQLFGDTMNTAARMEHTGVRDRIQVSQETADLLIAAGKTTWVTRREDVVIAKGKGEMQTYWLEITPKDSQSTSDRKSTSSAGSESNNHHVLDLSAPLKPTQDPKTTRLVDWNVDVLLRLMKLIVSRRKSCVIPVDQKKEPQENRYKSIESSTCPLDEVKEIITLPGFIEANELEDPEEVLLPKEVGLELHDYVSHIAAIYNKNPFHSFEHASHVTMSVVKLLSRIVAPQQLDDASESYHDEKAMQSTMHDHTYGITSDPLTQFSCVLSALIHDVDHLGVPNAQLVKEGHSTAQKYAAKSPAEQNSVDLAWNLLMEDRYATLRSTIYQSDAELVRFRQLVVNSVLATDIADKELKALRNLRWDRAFSTRTVDSDKRDTINRKATIVIEHLIQASDVAHTMQHWHIYRKWNERFFIECYQAYKEGRAETNPADGWYDGEIGFFDYYIVPLAKKLKDCGVFGVSSDEYLTYAMRNRQEWESRGREIVSEMVEMVSMKMNQ